MMNITERNETMGYVLVNEYTGETIEQMSYDFPMYMSADEILKNKGFSDEQIADFEYDNDMWYIINIKF